MHTEKGSFQKLKTEAPSRWAPDEKCWIVLTPKTTQTHKIKSKAFKPQSNIYAYKGQGNLLNTSI